jgi:HSP20 family protein
MARFPLTLFTPGSLMGAGSADPFLTLHREMNRLFDDAMRGGVAPSGGQAGALLAPHMDVSETDKDVRIQAELPGVSEKDIEVSLNDDMLTIRAEKHQERREERQGTHFSERSYGTFQRSLRLPFPVSQDQVQATFENGVLSVTLPKAQPQERSHRIQVQGPQQAKVGQEQQPSPSAPAASAPQSNGAQA